MEIKLYIHNFDVLSTSSTGFFYCEIIHRVEEHIRGYLLGIHKNLYYNLDITLGYFHNFNQNKSSHYLVIKFSVDNHAIKIISIATPFKIECQNLQGSCQLVFCNISANFGFLS